MSFDLNVLGLPEMEAKMKAVNNDVLKKGGRASLRKAAKVIEEAAKKNAAPLDDPATQRSIAENITIRWNGKLFKRTKNLGFRVGVQGGAKLNAAKDNHTPHWRLLEFGTINMRANPFMRPALAENVGAATITFIRQYKKSLQRAINRANKGKG